MAEYTILPPPGPIGPIIHRPDRPALIGLSGKAGSGKDTAAGLLARHYGYAHFAFASLLKEVVGLAFNFSQEQLFGALKDTVDPRWGRTPRWCLQHFGTAFRAVHRRLWIIRLQQEIREFWNVRERRWNPVVISDVRLFNEALAVKEMGGVLWRLAGREAEVQGIPGHASETELDGFDFDVVLDNAGSIGKLHAQIDRLLSP